ncbi:DUF5615 family PIN-like protein [Prosthecomicrobium sp. N25]|uniref:DUF5615 family PIN-like protein n=1 Tax=Prosthecomicrobium sp. N25 TaxID=3129254 RepID=UPI0030779F15
MNRFLVDECLSPLLAETARARGYDSVHVVWLGRSAASDRDVMRIALERDYIVVTNNARDFLKIYRGLELHPGLLLVLPVVSGPKQNQLFVALLDFVEARAEIVNQVVSIDETGGISIQDWSRDRT